MIDRLKKIGFEVDNLKFGMIKGVSFFTLSGQ
jgi:hypothetical protein